MKVLYSILLFFLILAPPLYSQSTNKDHQDSDHKIKEYLIPILPEDPSADIEGIYKKNLNLNLDKENMARRGEIVFFSSLSYLWVYQFIVMDILFSAQFSDLYQSGKLSSTNFLYSIFSSILLALMVTRKDTQFLQVTQYKEPPTSFITKKTYYREEVHEWRFAINFMSYDF